MRTEVSVVLPAYDEAGTIEGTVERTVAALESFLPAEAFEVFVAEDGCNDRTPEIASRLAREDERIHHVHSDERLGRGGALERAFRASEGDVLVYFDTDLATDLSHLSELVESVRSGPYDVATGSRWMPDQEADRPLTRDVASRGFNGLVRTVLRSSLRDHQCGFKAFDRTALFSLLDDVEDEHWFWDTEVLVRAQRRGYRVREFPVDWEPKGDSKVNLVSDVVAMGSQIFRTWWQLSVRPRVTRRVSLGAGVLVTLLALVLMTQYIDPEAVLREVGRADPGMLALAAAAYVVSWPIRGARYRDILAELGFHERVGFLTGAVFISQTGNLVFPARAGDAVRAYVLKARRGVPYPSGFASLAVERVFDLLTITALAGSVLVALAATGTTGDLASVIAEADRAGRVAVAVASGVGGVALVAAGLIAYTARSDANRVRRTLARVGTDSSADYLASILERFVGDVQRGVGSSGAFGRIGITSVAIWALDVVTAVLVLAAFGVAVPPAMLVAVGFFAVSVGNLAKVLPLSPGGIGLYEAAFTVLIVGLTPIGGATALGAAIVDHAVKNVVTLLGGAASMVVLNVSLTTAVDRSAGAREVTESAQD
jgi:hypothetical protein